MVGGDPDPPPPDVVWEGVSGPPTPMATVWERLYEDGIDRARPFALANGADVPSSRTHTTREGLPLPKVSKNNENFSPALCARK